MSYGDHQVANVTTEVEARTIGAKVRRPSLDPGRSPDVTDAVRHPDARRPPARATATRSSPGTSARCGRPRTRSVGHAVAADARTRRRALGVDPHDLVIESEARIRRQISEFMRPGGRLIEVCGGEAVPRRGLDGARRDDRLARSPALHMLARMTRTPRLSALGGLVTLAALLVALTAPGAASAASCNGTFQVLHNDSIGALKLPAGPYKITTAGGLGCTSAATLFAGFLQDFDGNLTPPWRVIAAQSRFVRGSGPTGFTVKRSGGGGGCPVFTNPTRSNVGTLTIPPGDFSLTSLSRVSCRTATQTFSGLIEGLLPSGWVVDPINGTFARGVGGPSFKTVRNGPPSGGGGNYPNNGVRCANTFRVLNNDRVAALSIPKGTYALTILSSSPLSCTQVASLFRQFLNFPSGNLPSPWVVNPANASFTKGRGSKVGFFIEPAA